jgi:hypothetical protein
LSTSGKQLTKLINRYGRVDLIVVDALGYRSPTPAPSAESRYHSCQAQPMNTAVSQLN